MKIKKISGIVILILVLTAAISGCGKKDKQEEISTEPSSAVEESTEKSTEPIAVKAKTITLSGDASEVTVVEEPSYIVSDRFIIYADAGVEINGDTESFIKDAMAALEEVSGMTYDNDLFKPESRERAVTAEMEEGYDKAADTLSDGTYFYGVDLEQEKMCIFIVPDAKETWAYNNGVYLRQADLKPEGRRQAVSELAGLLCLRIGNVSLGDSIDGGMQGYLTQKIADTRPELGISFDGFSFYNGVANSLLTEKNGSNLICTSHGFEADSIGFRFIVFINETYNGDIIKTVYTSCANYRELFMGEKSGAVTMQKVVELIKKATSDNVFVDFYEWYKVNAVRFGDTSYIEPETSTDVEASSADEGTEPETETEFDWQAYFEAYFGK